MKRLKYSVQAGRGGGGGGGGGAMAMPYSYYSASREEVGIFLSGDEEKTAFSLPFF